MAVGYCRVCGGTPRLGGRAIYCSENCRKLDIDALMVEFRDSIFSKDPDIIESIKDILMLIRLQGMHQD